MAKPHIQGDSHSITGIFRDQPNAEYAIDRLGEQGFEAIPIPADQAKTYQPNIQSDEILVSVECGDNCEIAKSILADCGASNVASPGKPFSQAAASGGRGASPILTPQDTERVIDVDGEMEVKEGPYVEPDMTTFGDAMYP